MQAKHTPVPWKQYANGASIYGSDGAFVAAIQSKNPVTDAALIVRAVNRQPIEADLLAALKVAESTMASLYRIQFAQKISKMSDGNDNWVLNLIRAAIARAEEV